MSSAASAATTVDSAATQEVAVTPAAPAFDAADQNTWSRAQREHWNETGNQPTKADSAPANKNEKDKTKPDSSTGKEKTADTASDSAADTEQKRRQRTPEDTEKRIKELLEENKTFQRRIESLERGKGSETRDTKQESQPAAEVYKPLDEKEFFKGNPEAGKPGHKTYEDFVRAAAKHEAKWEVRQEMAAENQRRAVAEAQKDLNSRIAEAKKIYPDYQQRVEPAVKALTDDPQIPFPVKAIINDSPVFEHLLYVLGENTALADLVATAKTNPAAAIRKIVLTEQLVQAELAKTKSGDGKNGADDKAGDGKTRDSSGKFVSSDEKKNAASETKPRAPKPPSEVGGRGTVPEDELKTAAAANDFRAFEAEQNRRMKASRA
jgi:hypothetical protein